MSTTPTTASLPRRLWSWLSRPIAFEITVARYVWLIAAGGLAITILLEALK